MFETEHPTAVDVVKCEVCFKEIPKSEAQSVRARTYVAHVCGTQCYEEWEEAEMRERTQEAGEP